MIEKFLNMTLHLLRGQIDVDEPTKAGQHGTKEKILTISGLIGERDMGAAMYLLLDYWEQNATSFHAKMRSPSEFWGFEDGHLRHEMAVTALTDTAIYTAARLDPEKYTPQFTAYIKASHVRGHKEIMTSEKRGDLRARRDAFIRAAQMSHEKWNGKTWTHALHILGALTSKKYSRVVATAVLKIIGVSLLETSTPPSDAVGILLVERLAERAEEGEMATLTTLWGLKEPQVLLELRATAAGTSVSTEQTLRLFVLLRDYLFIGFAHNLLLESTVSRLAMKEKQHPRTHAVKLNHIFLYHMRKEPARKLRRAAEARSTGGDARRKDALEAAANGSELQGANRSKKQQVMLASDVHAQASFYETKRALIFGRCKRTGIRTLRKAELIEYVEHKLRLPRVKVEALVATCEHGPTGKRRASALTTQVM
jgi:hypothetical protein